MPLPTNPCGCEGTFTITYSYQGSSYTANATGYENDQPYLKNSGGLAYLWSACRNVDMRGGQVWAGTNEAPIQSYTFTKTNPLCGTPDEPPQEKYDCINGSCIPKTTYNTPGLYQSLSACEIACGTGCSGKCISNSDWAQIEGLSSQLRNKSCS
jgi:hypothetical protein